MTLDSSYNPKETEEKWYQFWEKRNFFKADANSRKEPFCIVIPPPNVTGVLHMGHALVNTLQDILIRWKRMSGYEALWVPGTDHAGIATQTVVERRLIKTTSKKRVDFSRKEFLDHVWAWKEQSEKDIIRQLRSLGSSCDWSRLHFTMDKTCSRAVRHVFKKMFDDGLIYRGDYLVHWDPVTQTALADDEVEYEEKDSFLWFLRYPVDDGSFIVVATTRPETMLGDTAVAFGISDSRYQHLLGKYVKHPITGRSIPFIADHAIDPEFGTGLVKITPAHDQNDYQMGIKHNLPMINIMTPDGRINENGGEFAGLSMLEARTQVVEKLKSLGLIEKTVPHRHRVGVSYRSKAVIEPYLSKQWFVKMSAFKEKLLSLVKDEKVKLIPKQFESVYFHWIDNLRDWCISRQLWWGHRIPIWYSKKDPSKMICSEDEKDPKEVLENPQDWVQEEDVLDTWFSSGLWPFSVLGYPEKTKDFEKFYPNSVLVTGHDILFFWVARMILMGEYATGKPPFPEVFLHGLIYGKSYWQYNQDGSIYYISGKERESYDMGAKIPDQIHWKWEKMSKSKGNIIDPLEMIDKYGTDALRMGLCASAGKSQQIDLDLRRFEEFKNFANKIWNGSRFTLMNIESLDAEEFAKGLSLANLELEDRWILKKLSDNIKLVISHLENYDFDQAALAGYDFFWKEFCSYYLEIAKPTLFGKQGELVHKTNKQKVMVVVLCSALRLLHPIAPFLTEELFSHLKNHFGNIHLKKNVDPFTEETIQALLSEACIVAPYPRSFDLKEDTDIETQFSFMQDIVYGIRNIRAEMQLPLGTATNLYIHADPQDTGRKLLETNLSFLKALVKLKDISFSPAPDEKCVSTYMVQNLKLIIPLPEEMKQKEILRLEKEKEKLIEKQNVLSSKLANGDFVSRAPAALVEKHKIDLSQTEKELVEISKKLNDLSF